VSVVAERFGDQRAEIGLILDDQDFQHRSRKSWASTGDV
jgi:hypothetical protein